MTDTLNRRTVTIILPTGYKNAEEFARDCNFDIVSPDKIPLKPEGQRTKAEEWEACYRALFNQLNPVMEENARLKAEAVQREIPGNDLVSLMTACASEFVVDAIGMGNLDSLAHSMLDAIRPYLREPKRETGWDVFTMSLQE
jgi:hypothetical protein